MDDVQLPPLPECDYTCGDQSAGEAIYREATILAYTRQAVLAERERCAKAAESFATCSCEGKFGRCNENDAPLEIAAAIRHP